LLVSSSLQENGIAVTVAAPPVELTVEVEFPVEMIVGVTGAVVIAGELDGSSASLEGTEELLTASVLELLPAFVLDSSAKAVLELPIASAVKLSGESLVGTALAADARTVVV
jgi:hypothetical protein